MAKAAMAKAPAVNPCHAKMGTVFHVADPMGRDTITFTSSAPLEDIVGTSNQVRGYVVFDPSNPKKGGRGVLSIPVATLKTGIPLRDEHLQSADWLNAAAHPEITFTIKKMSNIRKVKGLAGQSFQASLEGDLEMNGRKRKVRVSSARFAYLPESERTKAKAPGDLLAGRASLSVSLKDFGVKGFDGVIGSKVSEKVQIRISFVASSKMAGAGNPCNPCNPCAKKKRGS